jgi:hypothetical protein
MDQRLFKAIFKKRISAHKVFVIRARLAISKSGRGEKFGAYSTRNRGVEHHVAAVKLARCSGRVFAS